MLNVLYVLAVLWSLGCVLAAVWCTWALFDDGSYGPALLCGLLGFPLAVLMAASPWMVFQNEQSPVLATLKKGEWVCTEAHYQNTTTYVKSGSVMVPVTSRRKVCDQWNRL